MLLIVHSNLLTDGEKLRDIDREIVFTRIDIRKNMEAAYETSAAYLRVLKSYEARDERIRKLHEEEQLKKLDEKFSTLNNAEQVDANVRDRDDGVRVDDGKQIKKGFTREQMRLLKLELACKDELWLTEVSADGIHMDYLTPAPWSNEPWFTEAPKDALCTRW